MKKSDVECGGGALNDCISPAVVVRASHRARAARQQRSDALPSGPQAHLPVRLMPDMPRMTAVKFRNPLGVVVLVKADEAALHSMLVAGQG